MANPVWPASVPETPAEESWQPVPRPQSIGFQPSRGGAIRRAVDQQQITDCSFQTVPLTQTQKDALVDFYQTTLGGGALAFDMTDPDSSTTMTFAFTAAPVPRKIGGTFRKYRVALQLERFDN